MASRNEQEAEAAALRAVVRQLAEALEDFLSRESFYHDSASRARAALDAARPYLKPPDEPGAHTQPSE